MMSQQGWQFFIEPSIEENLIFSQFSAEIQKIAPQRCAQDKLDLKKFLILILPISKLKEVSTKFKYYQTKWYVLINDIQDEALSQKVLNEVDSLNGFILEQTESEMLPLLIEKFSAIALKKNDNEIRKSIQEQHLKVSQEASRYLDLLFNSFKYQLSRSNQRVEQQVKEMVDFFLLRRVLLELDDEKEINEFLNQKFKRWGLVGFQKVASHKIQTLYFEKEKRIIMPSLLSQESETFYLWDYEGIFDAKFCFTIYNLMLALEKHTLRKKRASEMISEESLWENVFTAINFPMVLLSSQGDIIIHNNDFSKAKILPKDCLQFENESGIEVAGTTWITHRRDINYGNDISHLFVFQTNESDFSFENSLRQDSSELGIVSGSIAHELNNPIGGILASLAVLELDDHWSEEARASLDEMKKGARRCKDLVEIFLGFSKSTLTGAQGGDLSVALERALHLLRFRMIESGLRVEVEKTSTHHKFDKIVNSSIMAMFFYLLLNEVLTFFAHNSLLHATEGAGRVLKVEFYESTDRLSFKFNVDMVEFSKVSQSKLISHLLELEGIELEQRGCEFYLYRRNLL